MNTKILAGLNVVLLIAVIILFVMVFQLKSANSGNSNNGGAVAINNNHNANSSADPKIKIAYFELDSLSNNYTYYKNVRKALSAKESQIGSQLTSLKNNIINKMQYYQEKGPSMSQTEQVAAQQDMQKMQESYGIKEQELTKQFHDETNKKLLDVKSRIQNFLKVYAKEKGYAYVVATSEDDNIFYYKDSVRNITSELVNGLNKTEKPADKTDK